MHLSRNKTIASMFALFLMLTITLGALPLALAHTSMLECSNIFFLQRFPQSIGVGQQVKRQLLGQHTAAYSECTVW